MLRQELPDVLKLLPGPSTRLEALAGEWKKPLCPRGRVSSPVFFFSWPEAVRSLRRHRPFEAIYEGEQNSVPASSAASLEQQPDPFRGHTIPPFGRRGSDQHDR